MNERPRVMGLLQNQWFNDPERMTKMLAKYEEREEPGQGRARFIRDFLFFGCLTGKRLDAAFEPVFGDEWRWMFVWEEVSLKIGGHSSSKFPAEPGHILSQLKLHEPEILVMFGQIPKSAYQGEVWRHCTKKGIKPVFTCHPAARGDDIIKQLTCTALLVKEMLK